MVDDWDNKEEEAEPKILRKKGGLEEGVEGGEEGEDAIDEEDGFDGMEGEDE